MLDIAHSFVEISSYVDHKFVPDDENVIDGMEMFEMPKPSVMRRRTVMCELAKVRARAIRLEHSMKSQRSEGLTGGSESYRYLTITDKKDEEGFTMNLDKIKRCESWSEEERMAAFRYGFISGMATIIRIIYVFILSGLNLLRAPIYSNPLGTHLRCYQLFR
uniref:Transmembrane protein n=1 Tax=Angiostrongylus cantonensis TaxID=6313 RepID=A0A0K0D8P3_ANGCA